MSAAQRERVSVEQSLTVTHADALNRWRKPNQRVRIVEHARGFVVGALRATWIVAFQANTPGYPWTQNEADYALYATRSTAENAARFDGFEVIE